jgi:MYXO-CTERM domain-containing protein
VTRRAPALTGAKLDGIARARSHRPMRRALIALALPFAWITLSAAASADVSNPGPKCKCSTPGVPVDGSIAGAMLGAGGVLLLASRARRRKR